MAKRIVDLMIAMFFIFSFSNLASATLNIESLSNLIDDKDKPELYCGLALPVEGEPGGEGGETDNTQEEPQDGSESEPASGSPSNDQPDQ